MSTTPPRPPATPLGAIRKYRLFLTEDGSIASTLAPLTKDATRIIREQSGEIAAMLHRMEQQGRPLKPIHGTNQLIDALIRAKPAGWRRSATGNWYYEDRENRSDTDAERGAFTEVKDKEPQKMPESKPTSKPEPKQEDAPTPIPAAPINEDLARRALNAYSWSDYKPGSETASYNAELAELHEKIEEHKKHVDPIYYEKIDAMFAGYAKKYADWINRHNANTASHPSWFIAGSSNYNTRKHEKQMAREGKLWEEYDEIKRIPERILKIGTSGAISSTDKDATLKLQKRIAGLEEEQARMKRVNAYFRKHKTMEGCPDLPAEEIEGILETMRLCSFHTSPFETYQLSNNLQNIKRLKQRLNQLEKTKDISNDIPFDGGHMKLDGAEQRVRIYFDEKPDVEIRTALKRNGFKWSPKAGAWQRILSNIAIRAARDVLGIE